MPPIVHRTSSWLPHITRLPSVLSPRPHDFIVFSKPIAFPLHCHTFSRLIPWRTYCAHTSHITPRSPLMLPHCPSHCFPLITTPHTSHLAPPLFTARLRAATRPPPAACPRPSAARAVRPPSSSPRPPQVVVPAAAAVAGPRASSSSARTRYVPGSHSHPPSALSLFTFFL